ncbi:hypothetical protein PISMIDRAFT_13129 [Pisolithus microcarpus 441]|uniref:Uncharacterized protein n=1 Tax=Pisolithus microcarpus 441 TaxID=765257 RepID=A0A0C9Z1T2_9AGAM|nr:hypothetical protein PISMIDRAFT_13129 [Pisolithus microcarpus 441]
MRREEMYPEPIQHHRSEPIETLLRALEAFGRSQGETEPREACHYERAYGRKELEAQAVLEMLGRGATNSRAPEPLDKMPHQGSAKVLKFSGKVQDLMDYLNEIQFLCMAAGCMKEKEWIKWACWYLDRDTVTLRDTIMDHEATSWNAFVMSLTEAYPGALRLERTFVKQDLYDLVKVQGKKDIETEEDLSEYYCKYTEIMQYLVDKKKITSGDFDSYILEGLDPELKQEVLTNLKFHFGICRRDDPWPIDYVKKELMFLMSDRFQTVRSRGAKKGVVQLSGGKEATRVTQELVQQQLQVRAEAAMQRAAMGNPEGSNQFAG